MNALRCPGCDLNKQENTLSLAGAENSAYWLGLNPQLSITDRPFQPSLAQYSLPDEELSQHVLQFKKEGYTKTRAVLDANEIALLRQGVENIVAAGLPPVFVFIYDEFWQVYKKLSNVLAPIFGKNYNLTTNVWAWYVPPDDVSSGFKPHRDFNNPACVMPDGLPGIGTLWIPLTDVTPLNSCMYVLPTDRDPCYPHDVADYNIGYAEIQGARALPAQAGSLLSWNSLALHWGSHSSVFAKEPRISFATYLSRDAAGFVDSYRMSPGLDLSLSHRLAIISQVVLHYRAEQFSYGLLNSDGLLEFSQAHIGDLPGYQKQAVKPVVK